MIMALKWVQENIKAFHGDPDNVTLMGQGSGAAAASILTLSPEAHGLFARTILMSGTAVSPGVIRNRVTNATWELEKKFECILLTNTATKLQA